MTRAIEKYEQAIGAAKDRFIELSDENTYHAESIFAMQLLTKNPYALKVANANPTSVKLAMINAASTGLTLNPAHGYAYLVPRDNAIVLDISYMGLIKIATDGGAIEWVRAEVVREKDDFVYRGPATMPEVRTKPFATDRGEIIGAYCVAKTIKGDHLVEVMPLAEIEKIRAKSELFKKNAAGPWVEWFEQMCKKSVIKRARKTWPYSSAMDKMLEAIEMANEAEGGYDLDGAAVELINDKDAAAVREWMNAAAVDPLEFLTLYGVAAVEALPKLRLREVISTLQERANAAG